MKLLNFRRFLAKPTGFGSAGISRQREAGSLTIIGTGAPQRGIEVAEVGISVASYRVRYFPQIRESLPDNLGEIRAWAVSTNASREITIEGEVTGNTGVMAYTFLAAVTPANDIATFGSPSGGLYMTEVEEMQVRADWRKVTIQLRSDPGVS